MASVLFGLARLSSYLLAGPAREVDMFPNAPRFVSSRSSRVMVSVVIPTYNRGPFLRRAIASALAQEQLGELFDLDSHRRG